MTSEKNKDDIVFWFPVEVKVLPAHHSEASGYMIVKNQADFRDALLLVANGLPIPKSMMKRMTFQTSIEEEKGEEKALKKRPGSITAAGEFITGIASGTHVEYTLDKKKPGQTEGVFFQGKRVANSVTVGNRLCAVEKKPETD